MLSNAQTCNIKYVERLYTCWVVVCDFVHSPHVYLLLSDSVPGRVNHCPPSHGPSCGRLKMTWMWNQWCNCLPVMSSQSARDFVVPLLKHWLMCAADADIKRSAKAGLDALFLLLLLQLFFLKKKKHPCKYFSVLQKKSLYSFTGRASFVTFLKKEKKRKVVTGAQKPGMFFVVVVLRSKCKIVCYSLIISPIFLKIIPTRYSSWVVFDGTCIYPCGSDRYLQTRPPSSQTVRKLFLFSCSVTSIHTRRITLMKVEITHKCSRGS